MSASSEYVIIGYTAKENGTVGDCWHETDMGAALEVFQTRSQTRHAWSVCIQVEINNTDMEESDSDYATMISLVEQAPGTDGAELVEWLTDPASLRYGHELFANGPR